MKSTSIKFLLTLCLCASAVNTIAAKTSPPKMISLKSVLNADGSVKAGAEGVLSPGEANMLVNERNEPLFTAEDLEGADVSIMLVVNGKLYVGGRFKKADRRVVNNVAVWDGAKWSGLGKGVDGTVKAMCAMGNDIIVAGDFSYVDKSDDSPGIEANRLARWDGKKWHTFAKVNIDREIFALASDGKLLYAGGNFKKIEDKIPAASVAMWDGKKWSAVGGSKFDKTVLAMTCIGKTLYVGGFFTLIGDEPTANMAMWDGKVWTEVGDKGLDNTVKVLANDGKNVYAGGGFSKSGDGTDVKGLAMWDGKKWSSVGDGLDQGVSSIFSDGGKIYVTGQFRRAGGNATYMVAGWDGTAWSMTFPEVRYGNFKTAAFYNGAIHGSGMLYDSDFKGGIVRWNGSAWEPLSK